MCSANVGVPACENSDDALCLSPGVKPIAVHWLTYSITFPSLEPVSLRFHPGALS